MIVWKIIAARRILCAAPGLIDVLSNNISRIINVLSVKRLMRTGARHFFLELQTLVQCDDELNERMYEIAQIYNSWVMTWVSNLFVVFASTIFSRIALIWSVTLLVTSWNSYNLYFNFLSILLKLQNRTYSVFNSFSSKTKFDSSQCSTSRPIFSFLLLYLQSSQKNRFSRNRPFGGLLRQKLC